MKKKKILIIENSNFKESWKNQLLASFKQAKFLFIKDNKDLIIKNVVKCDAMIGCPRYVFEEENFNYFRGLEWIHAGGAGIENYMKPTLKASKIILTNGKIIQAPEVADHALALLLYFTRNIHQISLNNKTLTRPLEIFEKNALIIGLGGIGFSIAERLRAFGANVDALTNEMPMMSQCLRNVFYDIKNVTLNKYDFILNAAPLTHKTKSLIDYNFFKKMKMRSIFINVSRGKLLKTNDLLKNSIYKKFLGIGLDVTEPEPLDEGHLLYSANNVLITPHIAGLSDNNRNRGFNLIKLNIHKYLHNEDLLNIVDKKKEY